ncbi:MAG: metabolite traffic protein EboE [Limisphaerales bacterium]
MKLKHGLHLAYCTNIHRGGSWAETFASLETHVMAVRQRVCPDEAYAIGLRLGADAARELSDRETLSRFRRWLDEKNCYVFTVNGFPYGQFHGTRVKEQVYAPDWTTDERVEYTNLLFDLIAEIVPNGVEGSVSTVPVSYKEFITGDRHVAVARKNIWRSIEHIEKVARKTGKKLHLGLEPEPLCYLETSEEMVQFVEQMRADRRGDLRLEEHLGINYDCCHLAVEYESPAEAIGRLKQHKIKFSKFHISNALKVNPTPEVRQALNAFSDDIYFHQTIARDSDGNIVRHKDLDVALSGYNHLPPALTDEWRIHFHIPLHAEPTEIFGTTADHVQGVLDLLKADPSMCSHLEMETYTWEVMPGHMKKRNVVDQLVGEYQWTLGELRSRGLA